MVAKKECDACGEKTAYVSLRGWCQTCETQFENTMKLVNCVRTSGCNTPISCMHHKRCVQLRANVAVLGRMDIP